MMNFIHNHPDHVLFVLLLISRIGDIGTTYIATPKLKLEANPIVRKFRWPFALLSLLVAFVAYLNIGTALFALVLFLLVCASNASKMWLMRVLGEDEYLQLYSSLVRKASLSFSLFCIWAPPFFFFLLGMALLYFTEGIAKHAARGFIVFAFAMGFYHTSFYFRIRREVFSAILREKRALLKEKRAMVKSCCIVDFSRYTSERRCPRPRIFSSPQSPASSSVWRMRIKAGRVFS